MNKTAIKNFAIWARQKLIGDIKNKARMIGIDENGIAGPLPQSTRDLQFFDIGTKDYATVSGKEVAQRAAFVEAIKKKEKSSKNYKEAFQYIIEEVAYTWFNRLIAIRFMEVNDYLPSGIRVLSSENSAKNEPDFVTTPFDTDLKFTPFDQDKVIQFKDENKLDELFRMLFIKECNKLHEILPELFEETDDYTELLLTISFTDKDGVVYHLVHDIEEKDFNIAEEGQVEIIGWLYQYYNTEPKAEVFARASGTKISKEQIPAATQLFTPDWIVRYMVENSLGRLWFEGHGNHNLKSEWKYYLDEAEQEPDVAKQLEEIRSEYKNITPKEIKVIDPCMGSGHILVYAFDVLMQIYESYGYTQRDAARSILINNIHGLDIDTRAYQLAYFAVMMKARQYNRRILTEDIKPNLFAIQESNEIDEFTLDYFINDNEEIEKNIRTVIDELYDAKEYGSIVNVSAVDFELLFDRFDEIQSKISMYENTIKNELLTIVKQARIMAQKYDVVITNPPYMGISGASDKLNTYVKKNYPDSKADMFAVFIERCFQMTKTNRYASMITQHSWMFLSSFEVLRKKMMRTNIVNMAHLGARAFEEIGGEIVQTTTWVYQKCKVKKYKAKYKRLVDFNSQKSKEDAFLNENSVAKIACKENFSKIPGSPIAYWASKNIGNSFFEAQTTDEIGAARSGMQTGNNNLFLRFWFEVSHKKINFNITNQEQCYTMAEKWIPQPKGGPYRRWYGNLEYVVNYEENGRDLRNYEGTSIIKNSQYYFKEGISWSHTTSKSFSARYMPKGCIFNVEAPTFYPNSDISLMYVLGLMNTKVLDELFGYVSQTMHYMAGDMAKIPIKMISDNQKQIKIECIVYESLECSKIDWNSFETSWDFKKHPLLNYVYESERETIIPRINMYGEMDTTIGTEIYISLENAYNSWKSECENRFNQLKANEEELNRIFIDIYGLQDELTPDVEDKDVTVRKADLQREIKSLISYAVGCMLGRYSLDVEGLAYAGGEWDNTKYSTFIPDADNCLPITDEEYFEDDIVGRFVKFIATVYGEVTLDENLDFIAKALGNKGNTSREVIRNYFLNDFIKDHIKIYQKRPIYWLYDSGKQNGFKALVYMHRYNADTTGNMRVEYLHRMQRVYEKELERMQEIIDNSRDNKEISSATKRKEKLQKQLKETKEYDAKVAHLALSRIDIDLDDGVKVNYEKVQTASDGTKLDILAKI